MAKIIAELCQNHNGDWNVLKDMVWRAAEAEADYAKVQSMLADEIPFREQFEQERKKQEEKKKKEGASEAEKLMKHIKPRIP